MGCIPACGGTGISHNVYVMCSQPSLHCQGRPRVGVLHGRALHGRALHGRVIKKDLHVIFEYIK